MLCIFFFPVVTGRMMPTFVLAAVMFVFTFHIPEMNGYREREFVSVAVCFCSLAKPICFRSTLLLLISQTDFVRRHSLKPKFLTSNTYRSPPTKNDAHVCSCVLMCTLPAWPACAWVVESPSIGPRDQLAVAGFPCCISSHVVQTLCLPLFD